MTDFPELPPSLAHHARVLNLNVTVGRMLAQAAGMSETLEAMQAVDEAITRDLERAVREAAGSEPADHGDTA